MVPVHRVAKKALREEHEDLHEEHEEKPNEIVCLSYLRGLRALLRVLRVALFCDHSNNPNLRKLALAHLQQAGEALRQYK